MAFIWDQDIGFGDIQSGEMLRGEGLDYIVKKIVKENEIGQSCALQSLCMITRYKALIPEFLSKGVVSPILWYLHADDPKVKLYSAEILKNFTSSGQLLNYADVKFLV